MEGLNQLEAGWLLWIQENLRTEILDGVMPLVSKVNNSGILAIVAVIILIIWKKTRGIGVVAFVSLALEFLAVNVWLKPMIMRTRPFVVNEALCLLGDYPTDYSFPSGHTGCAFAVAFVCLMCLPRRYGISAIVVAALIAFSRLYNAAHYPTDVLAAVIIALITALLAKLSVGRWTLNRNK
ncbi:MAG: phosphatase PAP2 family protein [Lachnospiraceae bacterium]|nr:phosphatase PAP2 family protein [Lachnospiraceae bacterium]